MRGLSASVVAKSPRRWQKYLEGAELAPDIVLCSTAVRAKQTLDPIVKRIRPVKVVFERGIYEVPQRKLWKYLWALPENADSVLMIGHNPGLHELAWPSPMPILASIYRHLGVSFRPVPWPRFRSMEHGRTCGPMAPTSPRSLGRRKSRPTNGKRIPLMRDGQRLGGALLSNPSITKQTARVRPVSRKRVSDRCSCRKHGPRSRAGTLGTQLFRAIIGTAP